MSSLEVSANSFLRALTIYVDTPSSDTKFQLQRRANDFVRAVIEHENTIEQRVADNVLKAYLSNLKQVTPSSKLTV